jgi:hypothetical protein
LVALDISNIGLTDERLRIRLPSSAGVWHSGRVVTIPRGERADTCPVRSIRAWYAISGMRGTALPAHRPSWTGRSNTAHRPRSGTRDQTSSPPRRPGSRALRGPLVARRLRDGCVGRWRSGARH